MVVPVYRVLVVMEEVWFENSDLSGGGDRFVIFGSALVRGVALYYCQFWK